MGEKLIEIKELRKSYGDIEVLTNINLTIEQGDIYGLIGQSGAGKSTLLRCINGLEDYQGGSVKVLGDEIRKLTDDELRYKQKHIGMIFQQFELVNRKTVYQNIELPMKLWNEKEEDRKARVKELSELVGMTDKIQSYPGNLSGGQKQRVGIARALALNPKIILSDEATSALDPSITNLILDLLYDINQKFKLTIVVVTHEIEVIKKICNKVAVLEHGQIATNGYTEDLFIDRPPALNRLLGIKNEEVNVEEGYKAIKLIFRDADRDKDLLAKMTLESQVIYNILETAIEKIGNKNMGYILIEVNQDNKDRLVEYMAKNNIEYRVM